ncbi:hypothetical protein QYE76_014138 [Lolium multiflorum]|uniref:Uncharacterized protein n=1 Tax=Lolium multiflorum TaxID=4521 RepID=A0AAD8X5J4_LOLMU|nr:hypothetical protein QYE76_014138 [Lolium multiflorum]
MAAGGGKGGGGIVGQDLKLLVEDRGLVLDGAWVMREESCIEYETQSKKVLSNTLLAWKRTPRIMRLQPRDLGNSKHSFLFTQAWAGLQNPWSSCFCHLLDCWCGGEWEISAQDESLLSSLVFFGMLIGSCGWGFVSDKYGRRTCLLFSTLFTTGMGFISAFSPNYLCLMTLRFLVGIGVGGGQVVISALSWRWLLAFTALPIFLLLPFFGITPESPRYLCAQNRMSDATLVLERIAMTNQIALPSGILTYNREREVVHNALTCEIDHLLPVREKEFTDDIATSTKSGSFAALGCLLSRNLRRSTFLLWFVFFANSFAYYGLVLLTSQLSDAK